MNAEWKKQQTMKRRGLKAIERNAKAQQQQAQALHSLAKSFIIIAGCTKKQTAALLNLLNMGLPLLAQALKAVERDLKPPRQAKQRKPRKATPTKKNGAGPPLVGIGSESSKAPKLSPEGERAMREMAECNPPALPR